MADFSKYSNYTGNEGFTSVVCGGEAPVLEVEMNEIQEIQKNVINRIVRRFIGDGVSEPSKVTLNGRTVTVAKGTALSVGGYIIEAKQDIIFDIPTLFPDDIIKDDSNNDTIVVSLYAWEDIVTYENNLYKDGYQGSDSTVENKIMDSRYDVETSRRKVLKYALGISDSAFPDNAVKLKLMQVIIPESGNPTMSKYLCNMLYTIDYLTKHTDTLHSEVSTLFSNVSSIDRALITLDSDVSDLQNEDIALGNRITTLAYDYNEHKGVAITNAGRQLSKDAANKSLGLLAMCEVVTDWNNVTSNGFYMANTALNSPIANTWFYGIVVAHNPSYCRQMLFRFGSTTDVASYNEAYVRIKNNGSWGEWTNITVPFSIPKPTSEDVGKSLIFGEDNLVSWGDKVEVKDLSWVTIISSGANSSIAILFKHYISSFKKNVIYAGSAKLGVRYSLGNGSYSSYSYKSGLYIGGFFSYQGADYYSFLFFSPGELYHIYKTGSSDWDYNCKEKTMSHMLVRDSFTYTATSNFSWEPLDVIAFNQGSQKVTRVTGSQCQVLSDNFNMAPTNLFCYVKNAIGNTGVEIVLVNVSGQTIPVKQNYTIKGYYVAYCETY